MSGLWAVMPSRSAEEAVRTAEACAGRCGLVVTAALLAGPGPAVVSALAAIGPVLVLAGLHGEPDDAALAARRLVEFGATLVSVQAVDGPETMEAVAAAVGGTHVLAVTLRPGLDDAAVAAARLGDSRGRVVSRLAGAAAAAGIGAVLCSIPDLGVVGQVAPGLRRFTWGALTSADTETAFARGAVGAILDASVLGGRGPAEAIAAFG